MDKLLLRLVNSTIRLWVQSRYDLHRPSDIKVARPMNNPCCEIALDPQPVRDPLHVIQVMDYCRSQKGRPLLTEEEKQEILEQYNGKA